MGERRDRKDRRKIIGESGQTEGRKEIKRKDREKERIVKRKNRGEKSN